MAQCAALLLVPVLVLACLRPAFAQGIEGRLRDLMAEHDAVCLAVVVATDNAVVYRNSLGWKDCDKRIPLEADDVFRIASISRSFAATSCLPLVEQGCTNTPTPATSNRAADHPRHRRGPRLRRGPAQ